MDTVTRKVTYKKVGGNASKNATATVLQIPKRMLEDIGVTVEDRDVSIARIDGKIIIEKVGK